MTVNSYFDAKGYDNERTLVADIVEESIQISGFDVYYIPRIYGTYDKILGEDNKASFGTAIPIEIYLDDHSGPRGPSDMLSKFGFELKEDYMVSMSPRRFLEEIASKNIPGIYNIPREGDLIFMDLKGGSMNNFILLEIKFWENEKPHYQLGRDTYWELQCEAFRYNNEVFNTGIILLDTYAQRLGVDSVVFRLKMEDGSNIKMENDTGFIAIDTPWHNEIQNATYADNDFIQQEALNIVEEFSIASPFGKF